MAEGLRSLEILDLSYCNLIDGGLPDDIGCLSSLKELNLNRNNFERLPQSIAQLGSLRLLDLSDALRLKEFLGVNMADGLRSLEILKLRNCNLINGELLDDIGHLSSLKYLYLNINNFECLPESIAQLGSLQFLDLSYCKRLKELPGFKGMQYLNTLDLSFCDLTDGGLPEDIGSLSSVKHLNLKGNNFEYLPHSIAQLDALQTLDLSDCKRLRQVPGFTGMQYLDTLDLSFCNLINGELLEDIGYLSSLKYLYLNINNFEHFPESIAQLGALRILDLLDCKRLTQLPEFPQQLHTISADWSNDWICNSLFQNFSAMQHDISASDSLSLTVFTLTGNIPITRWFHHREDGRSISVKLPENWYVSDNFLGFAVCYTGKLIDAIAHLICYDERPVTRITQKLALSNHSEEFPQSAIHCFLVPLTGLLDKSKANGKTPNDYGRIRNLGYFPLKK